jgi:hypothetical protein
VKIALSSRASFNTSSQRRLGTMSQSDNISSQKQFHPRLLYDQPDLGDPFGPRSASAPLDNLLRLKCRNAKAAYPQPANQPYAAATGKA